MRIDGKRKTRRRVGMGMSVCLKDDTYLLVPRAGRSQ